MKKRTIYSILIITLVGSSVLSLQAQTPLKLNAKSSMAITKIDLSGTGKLENGKLTSIESLKINIPVKSIKSGKDLMDDKTYEALKADKYQNIQFELISAKLSDGKITGQGKLTIAGKTNTIPISSDYSYSGASTLVVKGNLKVDMPRYDVEPPTVLMGTISTGKDITIPYEIIINY